MSLPGDNPHLGPSRLLDVTGALLRKRMRRYNNIWSDGDVGRLRALVASGVSPLRAAVMLKRTTMSVQSKARLVGPPFPSMLDERKKLRASMEAGKEPACRSGV